MDEPHQRSTADRRPTRVVAALGPDILAGVPLRTLSDDYRDEPVDPPEERIPEPEPRGRFRRLIDRLRASLGRSGS